MYSVEIGVQKAALYLIGRQWNFCPYFSHFFLPDLVKLRAGDIRTVLSISFLYLKIRRREGLAFLMSVKMKLHLQVHCKTA